MCPMQSSLTLRARGYVGDRSSERVTSLMAARIMDRDRFSGTSTERFEPATPPVVAAAAAAARGQGAQGAATEVAADMT